MVMPMDGLGPLSNGEHWGIATLTGVVNTVTTTAAQVRWEDGDQIQVVLEDT
jgi:hypothetical protein